MKIPMVGFNGTVAFIKVDDRLMMVDRYLGGSELLGRKAGFAANFATRLSVLILPSMMKRSLPSFARLYSIGVSLSPMISWSNTKSESSRIL